MCRDMHVVFFSGNEETDTLFIYCIYIYVWDVFGSENKGAALFYLNLPGVNFFKMMLIIENSR